MPGRLCIFDDTAFMQEISKKFANFSNNVFPLHKQYNIAPTLDIAIFTNTKLYTYAHFGLIPSWANEHSKMQINARSETVFEKSSFKEACKHRRCLIPLNGYFEWKQDAKSKKSQAYFIHSNCDEYFVFAGIYESWYDNRLKKSILTCALLTTEPNETIATLHDRMPVILEKEKWEIRLDNKSTYSELNQLFTPIASDRVKYFAVSELVNSVKNDTAACITEVKEIIPRQGTLF